MISTLNSRPVIVAYSGVHQAFQTALAAQEAGLLDTFYGSIFDAPGKWGGRLSFLFGKDVLVNRHCPGLEVERLKEIPGPFLCHRTASLMRQTRKWYPWYQANFDFDRQVALRLQKSHNRLFVGTETCARDSFRVAGERGMIKVLDCPQVHPNFLTRLLAQAADDLGVPPPPPFDPPKLAARKAEEFAMADVLLMISEMHRRSFVEAEFPEKRLIVIPWGIDTVFWFPPKKQKPIQPNTPLRVLFVGTIGFRKGIPYLMQAMEKCGSLISLTLVGPNSKETDQFIHVARTAVNYIGTKTKAALRKVYWESDVLVLPSLVDTYGLVVLEAMACGLPVIVTDNCGVPVPDAAWRIPIMNSDAIAQRLEHYAKDREALARDGQIAQQFARQFTPERYREQIKNLLKKLLQK